MSKVADILHERLGNAIKKTHVHNERRVYLTVDKEDIKKCVATMFNDLDARYIIASGMENFDNFEILYHFGFDNEGTIVSLRVYLDKHKPEIESLVDVIPGISYIEREMWELLGINFPGHPGLKHFLLRDDWPKEHYPLRKNIKTGGESE